MYRRSGERGGRKVKVGKVGKGRGRKGGERMCNLRQGKVRSHEWE